MALFCHLLTLRSAFGFFHLGQITVTLLYNNFLPLLAVVLKSAKRELAALTFSPLSLEPQDLYKGRKAGRRYVKCVTEELFWLHFCFINR